MTEYLEKCEKFRTPMSLHLPTLYYLLEECRKNPNLNDLDYPKGLIKGNGENLIQMLFDKSPLKMRMYGSAKDLAENVRIYMNFPGCHDYFNTAEEPYYHIPIIFESLKNEKFICKSDLFAILQSMVTRSLPGIQHLLGVSLITYYLNSKEKRLVNGNVEFVKFDSVVFDWIWNELVKTVEAIKAVTSEASFETLKKSMSKLSNQSIAQKLKFFMPNVWSEGEEERILAMLNGFHIDVPQRMVPAARALMFTQSSIMIKALEEIINAKPDLFMPRDATRNGPVTVRVFEDGDKKFVMKAELFNAIGMMMEDEEQFYETIKMEEVEVQYAKEIKNIEFIRHPIIRAKHKAAPINGIDPTDPHNYCLLAVDHFFDLLKTLIFEVKAFQKHTLADWDDFEWLFDQFQMFFIPNQREPYFIKTFVKKFLSIFFEKCFQKLLGAPAKNIRDSNGFTLQQLKNELEYLGLTVTFPEIQEHAEVVYEHVDRVKKERFLRTCDLFDAIEQCQLICIFERLPDMKKFLHNQGGCGRVVGLKCQLCMDQQKTSEIQKPLKLQEPDSIASLPEESEFNKMKNELENEREKSARLEQELLKIKDENEKLMNKLSIGSSSKSSVTVVEKPITCIICQGEIEGQMTIDCPMCGTKFHKKCALQYGQHQTKCPACKGEIVKFIC